MEYFFHKTPFLKINIGRFFHLLYLLLTKFREVIFDIYFGNDFSIVHDKIYGEQ